MSGQHRKPGPAPAADGGRWAWLRRARGTLLWLGPLVAFGAVASLVMIGFLLPYQPFRLYSYTVSPDEVCTGDPVTAQVTREFTTEFNYLRLSESWVTVDVPGFPADRPIAGDAAELPSAALRPTGKQTVPSPLLREAPTTPGVYRVQIIAQSQGTRFGFFPAIGSTTTFSDDETTVIACQQPPPTSEDEN